MVSEIRKEILSQVRRVVVKVGTAVLTGSDGRLSEGRIGQIAAGLASLVQGGRRVALVTSGAIGAGMGELGLSERPDSMAQLQALAAVGQSHLMRLYEREFHRFGFHAGQILVTRQTFEERTAYLNVRKTLNTLESYGAVAVINENDSVSTDEIRLGENDVLSALVANLLGAELLLILTSVEGLLDHEGRLVRVVDDVDAAFKLVRGARSRLGTGGMATKLEAARIVTRAGEAAIIANGRENQAIERIGRGESLGTLFLPAGPRMKGRKRWMRFSLRARGTVLCDDGARRAVQQMGKSLLASGVTGCQGNFEKGDLVTLAGGDGREFARGLAEFGAGEVRKIMGMRSSEIEKVLGKGVTGVVVHRDNLVLVD